MPQKEVVAKAGGPDANCPAGLNGDLRVQLSKAPPNLGGGSLMTEHTDLYNTCYYL